MSAPAAMAVDAQTFRAVVKCPPPRVDFEHAVWQLVCSNLTANFKNAVWLFLFVQMMTPNKQGKGVQPGSGIPNNTFFKLTLYQFSSVQFSSVLIREPGARPRIGMFPALVIIDCSVFFIVSVRTLYHGPLIYIYIYMYSFTTIIITHKYHYCLYIYIYIYNIHTYPVGPSGPGRGLSWGTCWAPEDTNIYM